MLVTKSLLISMTLTYLTEIGYKFYTNQAVFIFNPCHCLCVVQIVILYSFISAINRDQVPSDSIIYLFRTHLYLLHGPLMAVIFPVTNTLNLWGEVETYWIEHALLLLIPFWLLKCSNMTVPASSWSDNIGWGLISYAMWGLFHFLCLQPIASVTLANLNSMLCPAITDPFRGLNYRTYGIIHQLFITLVCGCVINFFGTRDNSQQRKQMLD